MISVRTRRRLAGDAGAASLEYAGMLFVVVVVVGSLLVYATPVGSVVYARICAALDAVCGSTAAEQRAGDLGLRCTVARTNRELGYNVSVAGLRGERLDTDGITEFGDGAGTVVMSQGGGVGVDGSTGVGGRAAQFTANATANGDLGYVYSFPEEFGGAQGAQDFLSEERDGVNQAADLLVPGLQTIDEGATRFANGAQNFVQDEIFSVFGQGPSEEELAERERDQRAETADAVTVALSMQGEVGVELGAGVPMAGPQGQAPGSPGATRAEGPISASASLGLEVTGQSTIGLTTGESDSIPSSFQGRGSVSADAELVLGVPGGVGGQDIPPFLSVTGEAGAAASYKVIFDESGNPVQLVLVHEYSLGGGGGFSSPRLGSREVQVGAGGTQATVTERTVILDLDPTTDEGEANRAAFDDLFALASVTVDGHTASVVVPDITNPAAFVDAWSTMSDRIDEDGFIVDASYNETASAEDIGIRIAGTGGGGERSTTRRELLDATLYDNRFGGAEVSLATCQP